MPCDLNLQDMDHQSFLCKQHHCHGPLLLHQPCPQHRLPWGQQKFNNVVLPRCNLCSCPPIDVVELLGLHQDGRNRALRAAA